MSFKAYSFSTRFRFVQSKLLTNIGERLRIPAAKCAGTLLRHPAKRKPLSGFLLKFRGVPTGIRTLTDGSTSRSANHYTISTMNENAPLGAREHNTRVWQKIKSTKAL